MEKGPLKGDIFVSKYVKGQPMNDEIGLLGVVSEGRGWSSGWRWISAQQHCPTRGISHSDQ